MSTHVAAPYCAKVFLPVFYIGVTRRKHLGFTITGRDEMMRAKPNKKTYKSL
jgi:hypothetical protein